MVESIIIVAFLGMVYIENEGKKEIILHENRDEIQYIMRPVVCLSMER